jgi:Fic family protein
MLRAEELRESHILEFHGIAVADVYPCGGQYRDARANVVITGSEHELPPPSQVPSLIRDLVTTLNEQRDTAPAVDRAAYALWRFNWIHPFRGGNGRSARALSYLVLCMDMGLVPPGRPQFPTVIYENRVEYVRALRVADSSVRAGLSLDLGPMRIVVEDAIMRQLASAVDALSKPRNPIPPVPAN